MTARYPSMIFINDLVFFIQYSVLGNYAGDNLFVIRKNNEDIEIVHNWFYENFMILRCCSYGSELARLGGLAYLGEISSFLRNSFKKLSVFI